jgi:hypothetical protein
MKVTVLAEGFVRVEGLELKYFSPKPSALSAKRV